MAHGGISLEGLCDVGEDGETAKPAKYSGFAATMEVFAA
jgi:hypothetical protein